MKQWKWIQCTTCEGNGVVEDYGFGEDFYGPEECDDCCGSGRMAITNTDTLAAYPGGPFRGKWPGKWRDLP
jgi:DnaJ-class molecular chaperone